MSLAVGYTDDPAYSYILPTPAPQTFTANTTAAPELVVSLTRVIDTVNSWKANINKVTTTDELTTVIQKKDFSIDTNTT